MIKVSTDSDCGVTEVMDSDTEKLRTNSTGNGGCVIQSESRSMNVQAFMTNTPRAIKNFNVAQGHHVVLAVLLRYKRYEKVGR